MPSESGVFVHHEDHIQIITRTSLCKTRCNASAEYSLFHPCTTIEKLSTMISVLQCAHCNSIVGDTDVPILANNDGIEVKHAVAVEANRNGRVKCENCKEVLGTEDAEGKYYFSVKSVRRYTVQSVGAVNEVESQASKKRRKPDDGEEYVPLRQFEKFRAEYMKEMADVKETIISLFERLDAR